MVDGSPKDIGLRWTQLKDQRRMRAQSEVRIGETPDRIGKPGEFPAVTH
jgi:hypothetical protein